MKLTIKEIKNKIASYTASIEQCEKENQDWFNDFGFAGAGRFEMVEESVINYYKDIINELTQELKNLTVDNKDEFKKIYRAIRCGKKPTNQIEVKIYHNLLSFRAVRSSNELFKHYALAGFNWSQVNKTTRTIKLFGREIKIFNY